MTTWTPVATGTDGFTAVTVATGGWFSGDGWFVVGHFGPQIFWTTDSTATNIWTEV